MEIKTPYIWKNGKLIYWDDTLDHNLTHTLHYGGWVFEGIRFYNTKSGPKIFRLQEHIDRLFYSMKCFNMKISYTPAEIFQACIDVVKSSQEKSGYIRPIVYYGYGKMWLNPTGCTIETVISVWKWGKYLTNNEVHVKIPSIRRIHPETTDMNAKVCGNYANSILVSLEIKKQKYTEGLLLDTKWNIAEGPGENIFFIHKKNGVLTPSLGTILPGITRNTVIEIFKKELGIQVQESVISPDNLWEFQEAFFTGTAAEITPIDSITDESGKIFHFTSNTKASISKKIQSLYMDIVQGKNKKYISWLS